MHSSADSLFFNSYPSEDPLPEVCSEANTGKFRLQPLEAPNLKLSVPATGILPAPGMARQPNQLKITPSK